MADPSQANVDKMWAYARKYAEKSGTALHPDVSVTEAVVQGLAKHIEQGRRAAAGGGYMKPAHRQEIRVPGMPEPISHFTHVVRAGPIVFVSGCVASDENGKTVGGSDIVAQTRQVHENIKRCLAAAGATFADVCKVTVFLKNVADR